MKDLFNVRVLLTGLSLLGVFIAAAVVVVLMLAPRDDAPTFPETSSTDRPVRGNDEESSHSETDPIANTPRAEGEESAPPEASPPEIDDPPSSAELSDLQAVADRKGISLQEAIDRYGWNDNFALAVSRIREAAPTTFAGAEIVDGSHAWIAFTSRPPRTALDIIELSKAATVACQ